MIKIRICKEEGCHNSATTKGFCRLHYLRHWKHLKEESRTRASKKLNKYIESVMKRHPDRYMEVIKKDLRSPGFDKYVEDNFGTESDNEPIFRGDIPYDEEIEQLIRQLKVEKGY